MKHSQSRHCEAAQPTKQSMRRMDCSFSAKRQSRARHNAHVALLFRARIVGVLRLLAMTFVFVCLLSTVYSLPAHAACSSPAGSAGMIIYNPDYLQMQYCDGTDWIKMGPTPYVQNAVTLDGDYLRNNSWSGPTSTTMWTGSFWFRQDAAGVGSDYDRLLESGSGETIDVTIDQNSSDELIFGATNDSGTTVLTIRTDGISDSDWHHVVFSVDLSDTNRRHIYVDDVDRLTTVNIYNTAETMSFNMSDLGIGAEPDTGTNPVDMDIADFWQGFGTYIDLSVEENRRRFINEKGMPVDLGADGSNVTGEAPEIFLSGDTADWHTNKGSGDGFTENGTLTGAATTPLTVPRGDFTTGLLGHWTLDETTGTTATDSAGSNNGTMEGGLNAADHAVTGVRDGALDFDANDDRINVGSAAGIDNLFAGGGTISAWIYPEGWGEGTYGRIINKTDGGGLSGFSFNLNETGNAPNYNIAFSHDFSTDWGAWRAPENSIALNEWQHVVVTYDRDNPANDPAIYINGISQTLVEGQTPGGSADSDAAFDMIIGGNNGANRSFDGFIDDVRIYDRALSAQDVKALYVNSDRYCETPDGARGNIIYNRDENTMQFCNGVYWVSMNPIIEPTDGLVGHWKLDEMTGTTAENAANPGTYDGTMTDGLDAGNDSIAGIVGTALDFDGTNDNIDVADPGSIFSDAPMTVAGWIYMDQSASTKGSDHNILRRRAEDGVWYIYTLFVDDANDQLSLDIKDTDDQSNHNLRSDAALNAQEWYHWAVKVDAGYNVTLYINGVAQADTETMSSDIYNGNGSNNKIVIGTSNGFGQSPVDGILDDIRYYNRALSADEVLDLYKWTGGNKAGSTTEGLVGHWPLDEAADSTTVADLAGGNSGTESGGVVFGSAGQIGFAAEFDGNDDYIDLSVMNPRAYTSLTLSAWYKSTDTSVVDDQYIYAHNDSNVDFVLFGPTDDGGNADRLRIGFDLGNAGDDMHYGTSDVVDQTWHHLAAVRDTAANEIRVYVDGVRESAGVDAFSGAPITVDGEGPFLGDWPGNTEQVKGLLDDVRFYDRALSDSEISAIYNAGLLGLTAQDCTNPNGIEGMMIFNPDHNAMQFCDGRQWVAIKGHGNVGGPDPVGEVTCADSGVTVSNVQYGSQGAAVPFTGYTISSYAVPEIANGDMLIVGLAIEDDNAGPPTISSVTFNGTNMTQAVYKSSDSGSDKVSAIYYLAGQSGTTGDIVVTLNQGVEALMVGALSASCIKDQAPEATATAGTPSSQAGLSLNITTVTDGAFIVDSFEHGASAAPSMAVTEGPDQVELFTLNSASSATSAQGMSYRIGGSAGSHAMGWTSGAANHHALTAAAFEVITD